MLFFLRRHNSGGGRRLPIIVGGLVAVVLTLMGVLAVIPVIVFMFHGDGGTSWKHPFLLPANNGGGDDMRQNTTTAFLHRMNTSSESATSASGSSSYYCDNIEDRYCRFPTVDERVRIYMSDWYYPPCAAVKPSHSSSSRRRRIATTTQTYYMVYYEGDSHTPTMNTTTKAAAAAAGQLRIDVVVMSDRHLRGKGRASGNSEKMRILSDNTQNKSHHFLSPAANDDSKIVILDSLYIGSDIVADQLFVLDPVKIRNCSDAATLMHRYCQDVANTVIDDTLQSYSSQQKNGTSSIPLLLQFGDAASSHGHQQEDNHHRRHGYVMLPHLKKFRRATTSLATGTRRRHDNVATDRMPWWRQQGRKQLSQQHFRSDPGELSSRPTRHEYEHKCIDPPRKILAQSVKDVGDFQPIIWLLDTQRHYGQLYDVVQHDVSWSNKKNMAIFRGALTGPGYSTKGKGNSSSQHSNLTVEEKCLWMRRCRMVYQHSNSSLVDAKLTNLLQRGIPPLLDNGTTQLLAPSRMRIPQLLEYKMIIMLEGNDVASGLKWSLLSNSVVLMQTPTFTSWAMEEQLQPWVHYIPINAALSDVEEKVNWVLNHEREAKDIAIRASLWIYDLMLHPDAVTDQQRVFDEILRRYHAYYAATILDGEVVPAKQSLTANET